MSANDEYVVEILEGVGLISRDQGRDTLAWAAEHDQPVVDVLVANEIASKADILKALASQFGMEFVSLDGVDIEPEVIDLVPGEVAHRYTPPP